MKSIYFIAGLVGAGVFFVSGCSEKKMTAPVRTNHPLKIVTSFLPVYCLTANVAGELAVVENLLPPGVGPHDYQFSPRDLRKLHEADLIFLNGLGVEDWLGPALPSGQKMVVKISEGLGNQLIYTRSETSRGLPNPHIWLDPHLAAHAVTNILIALQKADPTNAPQFATNAGQFIARLKKLDVEIAEALSSVKRQPFITYHDAFPYFVQHYGLNLIGVVEPIPDQEPSTKYLSILLREAREKKVKVLFAEPQFSSRLMTQIAADLKIPVAELDPLETGSFALDAYENGMRKNLHTLE
ncbi:MAG: metal ABC transporter substrate-binding protein, partial [Verrucomicrobiota bacterium]|nr:metal ABC transporter substrate-binding protein [Verrucomicrobiota bacterium]